MDKEEVRTAITKFLEMCVTYADDSIERKKTRLEKDTSSELKDEIVKWLNYRDFTEYTIKEVLEGKLDDWLENIAKPDN